jgi:eukaryotic-like serine/threonine-protein kinase
MNDETDRELAIFTDAIKMPIQKRPAFLDIVCHGDENLRSKVEALLKAHDRIGNFMEEPPTEDRLDDTN